MAVHNNSKNVQKKLSHGSVHIKNMLMQKTYECLCAGWFTSDLYCNLKYLGEVEELNLTFKIPLRGYTKLLLKSLTVIWYDTDFFSMHAF